MFAVLPSLDSTSGYVGRGGCGLCGEDLLRGGRGDSCCSDWLQEEREFKQDRKGKHRKILAWVARQGSDRQVIYPSWKVSSATLMRPVTQIGRWVDSETALSRARCSLSILSHSWPGWTDLGFGKSQLRVWRPNFFLSMFSHLCTENQSRSNTSLFHNKTVETGVHLLATKHVSSIQTTHNLGHEAPSWLVKDRGKKCRLTVKTRTLSPPQTRYQGACHEKKTTSSTFMSILTFSSILSYFGILFDILANWLIIDIAVIYITIIIHT